MSIPFGATRPEGETAAQSLQSVATTRRLGHEEFLAVCSLQEFHHNSGIVPGNTIGWIHGMRIIAGERGGIFIVKKCAYCGKNDSGSDRCEGCGASYAD